MPRYGIGLGPNRVTLRLSLPSSPLPSGGRLVARTQLSGRTVDGHAENIKQKLCELSGAGAIKLKELLSRRQIGAGVGDAIIRRGADDRRTGQYFLSPHGSIDS